MQIHTGNGKRTATESDDRMNEYEVDKMNETYLFAGFGLELSQKSERDP